MYFFAEKTKSGRKRRKISFGEGMRILAEEKKNREVKGGKYMEKGNIFLGRRRKKRKIFGEGKYIHLWRRRKAKKEK